MKSYQKAKHEFDDHPKMPETPERKDKVPLALTQFKVTRVLYGEQESEIITILQLGLPNIIYGEIKIEKGQKLICFLRKAEFVDGRKIPHFYASEGWEDGFCDIADENNTRAFSNVNVLCKYEANLQVTS